jgi:flagellar hook-associated protein 1 FlgK
MSALLNTAITGIRVSQMALAVTGHNIVNANTEGYSRQGVVQSTNPSLRTAAGYVGTGVGVDEIIRFSQKFQVDQVAKDIGTLSEAETYLVNISQVNNLLATDQTNLARFMDEFFQSASQAINDPGSLLGRQLFFTSAQQLTATFKAVDSRLTNQNLAVNKQLQGAADNISSIGKQIAELNSAISDAMGRGSPNDLLDRLDLLVRELGRYVTVSTVERPEGGLNVYLGQGQPLVVGTIAQTMRAVPGATNPSRFDLVFDTRTGPQNVTSLMTGGEVGGLLRFRNEALSPAIASLGLLATSLAASLNEQNRLGMNLEGGLGGDIFVGINDPQVARSRVSSSMENSGSLNRSMNVTIDSLSELKASDYELRFTGPGTKFTLTRLTDNTIVKQDILPANLPFTVKVDGFSLNIDSGSFQIGDRFLVRPVSNGVSHFDLQLKRPEEFAFASPIRVDSSPANRGGASLVGTQVLGVGTDLFSVPGQLKPPMMIRFTSPTTYDVLDVSDPANPQAMRPPMFNLPFVPGATNNLLPADPGGNIVVSQGPAAGALRVGQQTNGNPGEVLTLQTTDPETGFFRSQQLALGANETAANMAKRLSGLDGVQATAYTRVALDNFQSGAADEVLQLTLNGVTLTNDGWVAPGESEPRVLPVPLNADYLRDRINGDPTLRAAGISATSDGGRLSVFSNRGDDLVFRIDGGGSLRVNGDTVVEAPAAGEPAVDFAIGGTVQVQLAANVEMITENSAGVFGLSPEHISSYTGVQITMTSGSGDFGQPVAGDRFMIAYNLNGSADNRNGLALTALNGKPLLGNNSQSYHDLYGQLAEQVGILTSQARVNVSASETLLRQSMDAMLSVSGVNLEEEAAQLIRLEQHYNASARLITLARDLFDTLLRM